MRIILIITLVMLFCFIAMAQKKHDYVWPYSGNQLMKLDFNGSQVEVKSANTAFGFQLGNVTFCSPDGQLILYSNGCSIGNENGDIIENGDSINFHADLYYGSCPIGVGAFQDLLLLPYPDHVDEFILIHKPKNPLGSEIGYSFLMYTHIIKNQEYPEGKVIEKNTKFRNQDYLGAYLTAIQHENQQDWWIIQPVEVSNQYDIFLLDKDGIALIHEQQIGHVYFDDASSGGAAKFSPDGNKYATYNYGNELQLFDFDRETGLLSNHEYTIVDPSTEQVFSGLEWSSNSRYLYASTTYRLYQVDTQVDVIENGVELIATWSGLSDPFPNIYFLMKLAPDCRIYLRSGSSSKSYHVIHYPNRKGQECGFVEAGLSLPQGNGFANFPNHPHWRVDEEEKCDSSILTMFGKPVYYHEQLVLYPNPVQDFAHVELPRSQPAGTFFIFDMQGIEVKSWQSTRTDPLEQVIDFSFLQSGNYVLEFLPEENPERKIYVSQFVVGK